MVVDFVNSASFYDSRQKLATILPSFPKQLISSQKDHKLCGNGFTMQVGDNYTLYNKHDPYQLELSGDLVHAIEDARYSPGIRLLDMYLKHYQCFITHVQTQNVIRYMSLAFIIDRKVV